MSVGAHETHLSRFHALFAPTTITDPKHLFAAFIVHDNHALRSPEVTRNNGVYLQIEPFLLISDLYKTLTKEDPVVACGGIPEMYPSDPNLLSEFGSLPLPPLDSDIFSGDLDLPENFVADLGLDDAGDFDFDFSFDDICLPSDAEDFLLNPGLNDRGSEGPGDLNSGSPESGSSNLGHVSSQDLGVQGSDVVRASDSNQFSGDESWNVDGVLNSQSPESGCCIQEVSGPASSQGSGNCNSLSSDSRSCDRDESGYVPSSPDVVTKSSNPIGNQKVKVEEMGKNCVSKRKKVPEDGIVGSRSSKFRRSIAEEDSNPPNGFSSTNEEEEKKKARLMRNRESAQLSRQRKKHYVEELEDRVRSMHSTIQDLNGKISYIVAENASLRHQLSGGGGGGMCPPPPPGMYPHPPMAPMAYPWLPCAPYVVKSQGSQIPLVPIPRLKPQQAVSAPKTKKIDSKKNEAKTKKVASVTFLGLLFFILLFGGLVPMINVKYGDVQDTGLGGIDYIGNKFYDFHQGKLLTVNSLVNGSDKTIDEELCNGKYGFGNDFTRKVHCERSHVGDPELDVKHKERASQPSSDGFDHRDNTSEPLVASLYVPRNDKLVKIDGNLIIHSVMASEKAMASHVAFEMKNRETGLAIPRNLSPALALSNGRRNEGRQPHVYRSISEQQKALMSGFANNFKDNMKSSTADGKMQQWFREGLAGPMLSSGMCTEVFQFDVSPASGPGAIIPAPSVANVSAEQSQNYTSVGKGRNRRILHGLTIPLPGSTLNITEEHVRKASQKESFKGNKSLSPMVVSVLVDPREVSDIDSDEVIRLKSLPRIFVVVLLDSVKYVTYSCMLPLMGSGPHLVAN
ncbi:bZIP transcription factor 17 [Malania oleifera]|uniref:bZIP transcription factor 17 n=1 Tax=Malania oleifera TaxID=397392 RepID=UPI0025AE9D2C|nr:bZIP transcription factor 17 [Malania oleifera]